MRAPELRGSTVAGLTFAVLGVLLLLEGVGWIDVPAASLPALLLVGLGLALLVRGGRGRQAEP